MNTLTITQAKTDAQIKEIATLANEIWHQHFTDIIGEEQVNYMVDKFQSYPAIKEQIIQGYEYYQIRQGHTLAGYTGIHEEDGQLFLSKLYIKKEFRGQHISTETFHFLLDLCRERSLTNIWLTCNKHNDHTLKVYDHWGFVITREQKADIGNGYFMDDYILEYAVGTPDAPSSKDSLSQ